MIPFSIETLALTFYELSRRAFARALLRLLRWLNPRAAGWVLAFVSEEDL